MSAATLTMDGIRELQNEFRALPKEMTSDTQPRLDAKARATAAEIRAAYPRRTGQLAEGVTVERGRTGPTVARARIINTAPHSHLYEHGTMARHSATGAYRGSMPANPVFMSRTMRARREVEREDIADVLRKHGHTVTVR